MGPPRCLLVGAGAVGQVYGWHLARGGADVTFLVRPHHREALSAGVPLYPLNRPRRGRWEPERWEGFGVLTDPAELAGAGPWDQVWLCVASPALRRGDWLPAVLDGAGDGATVVMLQPGLDDREHVVGLRPAVAGRLVLGVIAFIAWQSPLPGEAEPHGGPPGVAFFHPPRSPSPFEGPGAAAVVSALRRGGGPARESTDARRFGGQGSALLLPVVAGLEVAGWSFETFRDHDVVGIVAEASREASRIVAHYHGEPTAGPVGPSRWLARAGVLRRLPGVARRLVPFDLEAYFRFHFTKVGDQTRAALATWIAQGRARDLPVRALEALRDAVPAESPPRH